MNILKIMTLGITKVLAMVAETIHSKVHWRIRFQAGIVQSKVVETIR